jgi:hypothetical protein
MPVCPHCYSACGDTGTSPPDRTKDRTHEKRNNPNDASANGGRNNGKPGGRKDRDGREWTGKWEDWMSLCRYCVNLPIPEKKKKHLHRDCPTPDGRAAAAANDAARAAAGGRPAALTEYDQAEVEQMNMQCHPCSGQEHGAGGFNTAIELAQTAVAGPASLAATAVSPPPTPAPTPPLARYCDLIINAVVIVFAVVLGVLVANDTAAIPALPAGELDGGVDGVFAVFDLASAAIDGELVTDNTDLYSFVIITLVCCLLCVFTCGWRATPTSAPTKPTSTPTTPTSAPATAVPSARSHTRARADFHVSTGTPCPKWYAVAKGRRPGIYSTWPECEEQVKGYSNAYFRGFSELQGGLQGATDWLHAHSVPAYPGDGANRAYVPAYSDLAEPDFADPELEAASHHFVSVSRPSAGVVHRRAGAPPLFLLTLFTCIAPVESAAVHSLASAVATVRGIMAKHAFCCCGLLFFIALRSAVRIYFALSAEPAAAHVPAADTSCGVLHAMTSASRFLRGVPATIYGSAAAACSYTWDLLLQHHREHCTFRRCCCCG